MNNTFTEQDANMVLNNPGIFYFRQKGSSGAYTKAVFTNAATFSYTPEKFTQSFDDTGDVFEVVSTEVGEISFGFGKPFDLDFMSSLSGGLFPVSDTTAGAKVVANQTIAANWTDKEPIVLSLIGATGQAYAGEVFEADSEPAITSVTASTTGALVANDDYTIIPEPNSFSGYSIVLNTNGTSSVATTESIVIVFNNPTVVGGKTMGIGGIKNHSAIEGYYETYLKDGTPAKVVFYNGYYNGNFNLTFGTANSPEAAVSDVVISLKLDTNRVAGHQLADCFTADAV